MGKIRYAINTVRSCGFSKLKNEVKRKLSQNLSGNKLSNLFIKMCKYKLPDGSLTYLYAGYRDYIKPLHFIAHSTNTGTNKYFTDNLNDYTKDSIYSVENFYSEIIENYNISIKGKKILEVGAGDSTLSYFLLLKGAGEIHSTDIDFDFQNKHKIFINKIKEKLFCKYNLSDSEIKNIEEKIKIYFLDIQETDIKEKFDIILSNTVLEHIIDLKSGINLMKDLLKPGGIMIHQFNPFFSETGGHEFCILDFPWGHVRISEEEFINYLETFRNWEKDKALDFYKKSFNNPKLNLEEIDKIFKSRGLKVVASSEKRRFKWKPDEPMSLLLKQARRNFPQITIRDLLSDNVLRIAKS